MNGNANGEHKEWTRAQIYIALSNVLHTLARQNIDSTTMEGIDSELIKQQFNQELDGYECRVALAISYHHEDDRNTKTPKSRLAFEDVIKII
ncbi:MAG: Major NAD(P)H-flavin oxidoreductase [Candidatus Celerinatantimonas neptuna]|nr:MAG: Major NAD(P)H-flavin oxidoreductase [Candidatus Celerinatantimonas neptuna]